MSNIFVEISLVLVIAALVAAIMKFLRQPLIIGHIITGLIVGPYVFNFIKSTETINVLSYFGIALLLFIIGLSLNPRVIKEVGRISLITGLGQVAFTTAIGFFITRLLGFSTISSLYIALAISFSSTIIILKLLSDKKELARLHGKIAIGFLLVQDIIATVALVIVSASAQNRDILSLVTTTTLKGVGLILAIVLVSIFVLPKLSNFFSKSSESLFLFAIGWGFGLSALFYVLGFSIEIGALFAGVALASSPYSYEISSRMKPLRDFFIIIFFILLGSQMAVDGITKLILPGLILSAFVLIGNPLIVMGLMGMMGYTKRTSFKAGLAVAQISEFSMILVILGKRTGYLSEEIVSLITIIALVTIAFSTYLILYSDKIYNIISPYILFHERKKTKKDKSSLEKHEIILFGFKNNGYSFIDSFEKMDKKFMVVDYDPETVEELERKGINCLFGDADDTELLSGLGVERTKMIISTITDYETNMLIVDYASQVNSKAIVIVTSDDIEEAAQLYDKGATYVIMPHYIGTNRTSSMISRHGFDFSEFIKERDKHISYLRKIST